MYERTYGDKYNRELSTVEIAKLIRNDIKDHIEKGCLPAGKYSVRSKYFSGGSSIDIQVKDVDILVYTAEYVNCVKNNLPVRDWPRCSYTLAAKNVLDTLKAISNQYNHDGSEIMVDYFDVNFYFHANFDWQWVKELHGVM